MLIFFRKYKGMLFGYIKKHVDYIHKIVIHLFSNLDAFWKYQQTSHIFRMILM